MTEPMSDESALCTACGLCCTGALHDWAHLDENEVDAAAALGLPVGPPSAPPRFSLPCPKLSGATCTIYGARPRVCAAYACRLLEQVREGRPLDDALRVVAEAHRLAGELRAALGPGVSYSDNRAHIFEPSRDPATQLSSFAFTHYLDRHFRNRKEGPVLTSELTK